MLQLKIKKFKSTFVIILALLLASSSLVPTFAEENNSNIIRINNSDMENSISTEYYDENSTLLLDNSENLILFSDNAENSWNYSDLNIDPTLDGDPDAWKSGNNPDIFKEGLAPFGAKRGKPHREGGFNSKTTLEQYVENSNINIPAYFFTKDFNLKDSSTVKDISFNVDFDDAIIVYINSIEVYRDNTPDGGYNSYMEFGSKRGYTLPNQRKVTLDENTVESLNLRDEKNTISVELHQDREKSSDIYFHLYNLFASPTSSSKNEDPSNFIRYRILNIGENEDQRKLTWYSNISEGVKVELQELNNRGEITNINNIEPKKENLTNKSEFTKGLIGYKVDFNNLKPNTNYNYKIYINDTISETYTFSTKEDKDYSFFLVGDPQIGSGGKLNGAVG